MTVLAQLPELQMIGVFDRGIPNKERIVLKPTLSIDIGDYAVLVGIRIPTEPSQNIIMPVRDNMFWFGTGLVYPGDWLFLYTGHGTPSRLPNQSGAGHLLIAYWGRNETIFHDAQFAPAVVKFSNILIEPRPVAASQEPSNYVPLGQEFNK